MMKLISAFIVAVSIALLTPFAAFAHVVVTPNTASVGSRTSFSVGVPNERNTDVTSITLDIPNGVSNVMPNVMSGWTISTQKSGDNVSSITWTGTISTGQRADLAFSAQVPASAGAVDWKAHQTYADGVVVNWDQAPKNENGDRNDATTGPYSITKVVDDLAEQPARETQSQSGTLALVLSVIAVVLSAISLVWQRRR